VTQRVTAVMKTMVLTEATIGAALVGLVRLQSVSDQTFEHNRSMRTIVWVSTPTTPTHTRIVFLATKVFFLKNIVLKHKTGPTTTTKNNYFSILLLFCLNYYYLFQQVVIVLFCAAGDFSPNTGL